jgi:hypothetical protein
MRYFAFSLLLAASVMLPSCMMYNPPAVVVGTPVVVQPRPYWHYPRGNAYGWYAHRGCNNYNYRMPQGPGYGGHYGNGGYRGGHYGPRH